MSDQISQNPSPADGQSSSPSRVLKAGIGLLLAAAVLLAASGIALRIHRHAALDKQTRELAAPTVSVVAPAPGAPVSSFVLPGNVTAYTDAPIYARTSGYLARWYFDIGSRVKKGALLATISAPEADQQLAQAQADLATAQAQANLAHLQAQRYSGLIKSNAVSKQDTDTFVNQATATASAVRAAQANVNRLRQLQAYQRIYAPFDGIVTARTVDTGQLIDAGAGKELFRLQAVQTLRVYTNLPQAYAQSAKRGMKVEVGFPEHAGKTFSGTLVRTADAIDPVSRTLLVEIDLDNKAGELMPGSLAQVHFKAATETPALVIPSSALIFRREGLMVGTVVNGRAHLARVVMGQDDGAKVQIVGGLNPGDQVIQDPPDSLIEGQTLSVVQLNGKAHAGGK